MPKTTVLLAITLAIGVVIGSLLVDSWRPGKSAIPGPVSVLDKAQPDSATRPETEARELVATESATVAAMEEYEGVPSGSLDQESQEKLDIIYMWREKVEDVASMPIASRYLVLSGVNDLCIAVILDGQGRGIPTSEMSPTDPADYPAVYDGEHTIAAFGKWFKFHESEFPEFETLGALAGEGSGIGGKVDQPEDELVWANLVAEVDHRLDQAVNVLTQ